MRGKLNLVPVMVDDMRGQPSSDGVQCATRRRSSRHPTRAEEQERKDAEGTRVRHRCTTARLFRARRRGENTDNTEQDQVDSASVRSGASDKTFDSTMTAKPKDRFQACTSRHVPRAGSKSALDLVRPHAIHSQLSAAAVATAAAEEAWSVTTTSHVHPQGPQRTTPTVGRALGQPKGIRRLVSNRDCVQAQISTAPPVCVCDTCLFRDSGSPSQPLQKVAPSPPHPDYVLGVVGTKGRDRNPRLSTRIPGSRPEESRIVAASADGPTSPIDADELLDVSEPVSDNWLLPRASQAPCLAVCYDACDQRSYDQAKQIIAGVEKSFGSSFITLFVAASPTRSTPPPLAQSFLHPRLQTRQPPRIQIRTKRLVIIHGQEVERSYMSPLCVLLSHPEPLKTPEPCRTTLQLELELNLLATWSRHGYPMVQTPERKAPVRHIIEKAGEEKGSRRSIGEESVLAYGFPRFPLVSRLSCGKKGTGKEIEVVQIPTPKPSEEVRQIPPCNSRLTVHHPRLRQKAACSIVYALATVEQLIDKLFFCGVSEDVSIFPDLSVVHYLARVAQLPKRLKELEQSPVDPLLAGFIVALLQNWIEDYPNDFASPGAPSALAAVVRTACENTHLMTMLFSWAYSETPSRMNTSLTWTLTEFNFSQADGFPLFDPSYSSRRFASSIGRGLSPDARRGRVPALKRSKASPRVARIQLSIDRRGDHAPRDRVVLEDQARDWVRRGVKEDKLGKPKSIVEMNAFFDRYASGSCRLFSLDRAQERVRLVTHLCEVAQSLRAMNNYSSLRAFHVGINCVCETGDVVQSQVDVNVWRKYQSREKRFESTRTIYCTGWQ
ncbi:Guanine nucleotide exchange factor for Ras-like small GTPases [Rhizoctonia solani]|uniref:Guanine nucleotide exchange factor for Ras-like small GTPases n=1 Tax=Rhizoctonia solani TaxID=456999 RepID=A0A8H7IEB7_9AGAM|nr:Guanine nucleotide exchange factor for Ras-like small GTPases [Rhizoctonia solani]